MSEDKPRKRRGARREFSQVSSPFTFWSAHIIIATLLFFEADSNGGNVISRSTRSLMISSRLSWSLAA